MKTNKRRRASHLKRLINPIADNNTDFPANHIKINFPFNTREFQPNSVIENLKESLVFAVVNSHELPSNSGRLLIEFKLVIQIHTSYCHVCATYIYSIFYIYIRNLCFSSRTAKLVAAEILAQKDVSVRLKTSLKSHETAVNCYRISIQKIFDYSIEYKCLIGLNRNKCFFICIQMYQKRTI